MGSSIWRAAISVLVMPTPSRLAKKPTPNSFVPGVRGGGEGGKLLSGWQMTGAPLCGRVCGWLMAAVCPPPKTEAARETLCFSDQHARCTPALTVAHNGAHTLAKCEGRVPRRHLHSDGEGAESRGSLAVRSPVVALQTASYLPIMQHGSQGTPRCAMHVCCRQGGLKKLG